MTSRLRTLIAALSDSVFFFKVSQMKSFYRAIYLNNPRVKILGRGTCHWCQEAKKLVEEHNISYEWEEMNPETFKFDSVPQIWIDETHIGGYSDLKAILAQNLT